jgi:uncharacterized membrane protein YbaN (DUF454 family)
MNKIKKALWMAAGFFFLGVAYIGVVTPGIPWSTPSLIAAWCFSKSSERWHNYIVNHKLFGPFIRDWQGGRVFPTMAKWAMFICMDVSLLIIWFTTYNIKLTAGVGLFMLFWMIWASRYPGSKEEAERRKAEGKKLGWLK